MTFVARLASIPFRAFRWDSRRRTQTSRGHDRTRRRGRRSTSTGREQGLKAARALSRYVAHRVAHRTRACAMAVSERRAACPCRHVTVPPCTSRRRLWRYSTVRDVWIELSRSRRVVGVQLLRRHGRHGAHRAESTRRRLPALSHLPCLVVVAVQWCAIETCCGQRRSDRAVVLQTAVTSPSFDEEE